MTNLVSNDSQSTIISNNNKDIPTTTSKHLRLDKASLPLLSPNTNGRISSIVNELPSVSMNANNLAIDNATKLVTKFNHIPIFSSMKDDSESVRNQLGYNSKLLNLPTGDGSSLYDLLSEDLSNPNMNIEDYFNFLGYSDNRSYSDNPHSTSRSNKFLEVVSDSANPYPSKPIETLFDALIINQLGTDFPRQESKLNVFAALTSFNDKREHAGLPHINKFGMTRIKNSAAANNAMIKYNSPHTIERLSARKSAWEMYNTHSPHGSSNFFLHIDFLLDEEETGSIEPHEYVRHLKLISKNLD